MTQALPKLNLGKLLKWTIGAGAVATAAYTSVFVVDAGHRAVVFDRYAGISPNIRGEGIHFIVPILQWPYVYEVRTRPAEYTTATGSKDLQAVTITLRILFKPEEKKLPIIHQTYGKTYDEQFKDTANEVMKSVVAQYDARELITQREAVSAKIRESLMHRASDFFLLLEDVSLKHLSFSAEFATAIESKQVAQQDAERSKFLVEKAEQEKLASIIRASGDSEAAKLIIKSMESGPAFLELRKIEAMREIADTLSKSRNVIWLPNGVNMLMAAPGGGSGGNTPQFSPQQQQQQQQYNNNNRNRD